MTSGDGAAETSRSSPFVIPPRISDDGGSGREKGSRRRQGQTHHRREVSVARPK